MKLTRKWQGNIDRSVLSHVRSVLMIMREGAEGAEKRRDAFSAVGKIYEYNSQIIRHAILRARSYRCLDNTREISCSSSFRRCVNGSINIDVRCNTCPEN